MAWWVDLVSRPNTAGSFPGSFHVRGHSSLILGSRPGNSCKCKYKKYILHTYSYVYCIWISDYKYDIMIYMEEFTYCKYACSFVSLFSYICASLSIYFKVISVIYIISYNINASDNLASLCVTEPFSAMTYYPTEFAKRIRPRCFSIGSAGRHDSGSIQQMDAILKWMTLERDGS